MFSVGDVVEITAKTSRYFGRIGKVVKDYNVPQDIWEQLVQVELEDIEEFDLPVLINFFASEIRSIKE